MTPFERALPGLLILWSCSIGLQLFLHWFAVSRMLYRYGARFPTGFLPWRIFRELRDYRELLRAEARILNPYYFYVVLFVFNVLLGLTLGLYFLWQHTAVQDNPLGGFLQ